MLMYNFISTIEEVNSHLFFLISLLFFFPLASQPGILIIQAQLSGQLALCRCFLS